MNHYRKVIFLWIVMVVGVAGAASAKAPEVEWTRVIGGKAGEVGNCIQSTYDGGYIIAATKDGRIWTGRKYLKGTGCLIYLIKLDNDGNVKWENTYGDTNSFYSGNFVEQTSDSGFIIAGSLSLDRGIILLKTDKYGKTEWLRIYHNRGSGEEVYQTADCGYIIIGASGPSYPYPDIYILKVNAIGDSLWAKRYGYEREDGAASGQLTDDGGCVITGATTSFGSKTPYLFCRLLLMRIDSKGDTVWVKTFGSNWGEVGYCIRKTSDKNYIITGEYRGVREKNSDVYLLKVDSLGNKIWEKAFGGAYYDEGHCVRQTSDGGYIVAGCTQRTTGRDSTWIYIVRTDENGVLLWTKTDKNPHKSKANSVIQTEDGGFLIAGEMGDDVYLIKLKPEE